MLPLGHLGIGASLVDRIKGGLPWRPLLLGTLLPDLVDKPLYYVPALWTGLHGADLGLISGTRSLGHSLLFLAGLFLLASLPGGRRRAWIAIALGCATHLLLDNLTEPFVPYTDYASRIALLFPAYGGRFPVAIHRTAGEHFLSHLGAWDVGAELAGALLLFRTWNDRRRPGSPGR